MRGHAVDPFIILVVLALAALNIGYLFERHILDKLDAAANEVAEASLKAALSMADYRARLIDEMARYDDAAREGRISAKD
jgi:hypothetical protein